MMVDAQSSLRALLNVPDTHEILYMHGGAHGQFAAIPLNLCGGTDADSLGIYVSHFSRCSLSLSLSPL